MSGSSSSTTVKKEIAIKGSTEIVTEFFGYSVNSILYQRGIYPVEMFKRVPKYGATIYVSSDPDLTAYIGKILEQVKEWLMNQAAQKLVLVITGVETKQVLERWVFNIQQEQELTSSFKGDSGATVETKSEKEINAEISAIIRQITASVTFLPLIQEQCTFDLLVYTRKDLDVPEKWEESDPRFVAKNAVDVRLRSFSTKLHKIEGLVSYQRVDE
jgi:mitotic spindle assembly checkpoint protein MAD2